nr:unnamed protein product [Callosobruchus analis]
MTKELRSDKKELRRSVEFISEKYEEEKKRNKVVSDMLGSTTPIYVDEELTKETYALFKKAKQLLKDKGYKHILHRDCRILTRKADGNNVIWIKNHTVLDSLLN